MLGCGSNKDDEPDELPPGLEDHEQFIIELPASQSRPTTETGEKNSYMFAFTGDDFTKIKDAKPGSFLSVTYKATVTYAVGEIGWKSDADAGPVISGNGSNKNQTAWIDKEHLVIGDADFTIHIFNGGTLVDVTLYAAPEGYVITPNPKATTGGKKIFIPFGSKIAGNGDLSKADFKTITTAASGSLVFYFDDEADTSSGILKFGPKKGEPYKHYGINSEGNITDVEGEGWRVIDGATKTIKYTVAEIKAGVAVANTPPATGYNKFEINMGDTKKADLLYIELIP
jgi:hypothetical protein